MGRPIPLGTGMMSMIEDMEMNKNKKVKNIETKSMLLYE